MKKITILLTVIILAVLFFLPGSSVSAQGMMGGNQTITASEASSTAQDEAKGKEVCCGNSTYFPDCNHGAAMLGFIELAVSQGLVER